MQPFDDAGVQSLTPQGRAAAAWLLFAAAALPAGCSASAPRPPPPPPAGDHGPPPSPIAVAAAAVLASSCARPLDEPPVPAEPAARLADAIDVALYVAHPDDEAMYAGGTLARLQRAGRRVAVIMMTHGEGGRVLERSASGLLTARRDLPHADVAAVRDAEARRALALVDVTPAYVNEAVTNADFGKTTSCEETLARWNRAFRGGLSALLSRLVDDLRARRPRVVVTLDPRDDPESSQHGHHRAVGVLVELAARLAADAGVPGRPHVVEEVLACAPKDLPGDVAIAIPVDAEARLAMLRAYPSQFDPDRFPDVARRSDERFVLRWRARGAARPQAGSTLASLVLR